jgi:hypothetical protein
MINGIPHGGRMICGYNPWLHARIVSDLKIESDDERDCEVIRWREPPVFQWKALCANVNETLPIL